MTSVLSRGFFYIVFTACLSNYIVVAVNSEKDPIQKKCYNLDIDSLKWMMYSLNFELNAKHYKYDSLPGIPIPQCNIRLLRKDTTILDTAIYYFSFYKEDENEPYSPRTVYKIGIGFSCVSQKYFPIPSVGFPIYSKSNNDYDNLFDKQEKKFSVFLKNYKGYISPWLKSEAIKRKKNINF
jgi:hypothetical protein